MLHTAILSLGSNLTDRFRAINRAMGEIARTEDLRIDRADDLAGIYESTPVNAPKGSPAFLNTVVRARTALGPKELVRACQSIETAMGRTRSGPNAPRAIDIDLLLFDDLVLDDPDLMIPHPRMHERRFVLEPLCELAPALVHPILGVSIAQLTNLARTRFPEQRVTRLAGSGIAQPNSPCR